jgi:hypothetical protein
MVKRSARSREPASSLVVIVLFLLLFATPSPLGWAGGSFFSNLDVLAVVYVL